MVCCRPYSIKKYNKDMRQNINNPIHWIADEGKTFVRKIDSVEVGDNIWLGTADSIDNYAEVELKIEEE